MKKVNLFIDVYPGWQDIGNPYLYASSQPGVDNPGKGWLRCRVTVELPEVPWPHDAEGTFVETKEVPCTEAGK